MPQDDTRQVSLICIAGVGGPKLLKWQWDVLHVHFLAFEEAQRVATACVAVVGEWIEVREENGSYREVRLDCIHTTGLLDIAWFNRRSRMALREGEAPELVPTARLQAVPSGAAEAGDRARGWHHSLSRSGAGRWRC